MKETVLSAGGGCESRPKKNEDMAELQSSRKCTPMQEQFDGGDAEAEPEGGVAGARERSFMTPSTQGSTSKWASTGAGGKNGGWTTRQ